MKIRLFASTTPHQIKYASKLKAGIKRHGLTDVEIIMDKGSITDCDLAIFWAHKKHAIINNQKKQGRDYMVMERAYMGDRFNWMSLGLNGLNGRANFNNEHITDSSRWNKHFSKYLQPWKTNTNLPVLIIGQVPGDASHRHIDILHWYLETIKTLNNKGIPIIFRCHPEDKSGTLSLQQYARLLKFKFDTNKNLEDTLKQVRSCITFNSNSGVISTLAGVPTVSCDIGSMVYNCSSNELTNLDYTPDRTDWSNKISYCQWLPEELESGLAWDHFKSYFVAKNLL